MQRSQRDLRKSESISSLLISMIVADGLLTEIPVFIVYSGLVSLRDIRLLLFIAELNKNQVWCTDIGNANLEDKTKEEVCFIVGPEFKDKGGHY